MFSVSLLFLCILVSDCKLLENELILNQISSGNNACNTSKVFRNFDFSKVPQFRAMCNILPPEEKQIEILLENNVVPVLCMGLYDVLLKLCEEAESDHTFRPVEIIPPSPDRFNENLKFLSRSHNYSDINQFCKMTGRNKTRISHAASNDTSFWWRVINDTLGNINSCKLMCHKYYDNQAVHPLCSFTVWANQQIIIHRKSKEESQTSVLASFPEIIKANNVADKTLSPNVSQAEKTLTSPSSAKEVESMPMNIGGEAIQGGMLSAPTQNSSISEITGSKQSELQPNYTPLTENITLKGYEAVKSSNLSSTPGNVQNIDTMKKPPTPEEESPVHIGQTGDMGEINLDKDPSEQAVAPEQDQAVAPEPQMPDSDTANDFEEADDFESDPENIPAKAAPVKTEVSEGKNLQNKPASKISNKVPEDENPDTHYDSFGRKVELKDPFIEAEDSHFFTYFLCMAVLTILAYLAFHNKNKLVALAVEGRRTRGGRRRPNSSNYSKLDCSLEEAMSSKTTASVTHVLY